MVRVCLRGLVLACAATAGAGWGELGAGVGGNNLLAVSGGTIAGIYLAPLRRQGQESIVDMYLWPDQEEPEENDRLGRAGPAAGPYERPQIHRQAKVAASTGGDRAADASLRMIDLR